MKRLTNQKKKLKGLCCELRQNMTVCRQDKEHSYNADFYTWQKSAVTHSLAFQLFVKCEFRLFDKFWQDIDWMATETTVSPFLSIFSVAPEGLKIWWGDKATNLLNCKNFSRSNENIKRESRKFRLNVALIKPQDPHTFRRSCTYNLVDFLGFAKIKRDLLYLVSQISEQCSFLHA